MNIGKINGSNHFAIKLDLNNAFDKVEWDCLDYINILAMMFLPNLVFLVMRCIHTVSFSVLINGSSSPSFIPRREICQVDHLSPYLICAEGLFSMIRHTERQALFSSLHCHSSLPLHILPLLCR